jgi:hypothetical protein
MIGSLPLSSLPAFSQTPAPECRTTRLSGIKQLQLHMTGPASPESASHFLPLLFQDLLRRVKDYHTFIGNSLIILEIQGNSAVNANFRQPLISAHEIRGWET